MLDAGPLIAVLHEPDPDHDIAIAGYRQLVQARTLLMAPLPIVFEVYKWLLYETRPEFAQAGLQRMRGGLEILYPDEADLDAIDELLRVMPNWRGAMEDAIVALIGLKLDIPVWTFNYRDFAAFRNLHFWTPAPV